MKAGVKTELSQADNRRNTTSTQRPIFRNKGNTMNYLPNFKLFKENCIYFRRLGAIFSCNNFSINR